MDDMDETEHKDGCHVDRQRDEEHEEVAIVAPANAVVHPWTVVIKHLRKYNWLTLRHFQD